MIEDSVVVAATPWVVTTVGAVVEEMLMSETLPFPTAVAVTEVAEVLPVVNPSAKVPEKVPNAALAEFAAVAAMAVMPDLKFEKAAATCAIDVEPLDVKDSPLTVTR